MIVKEYELKQEMIHDGFFAIKRFFEYLKDSKIDHHCYIFQSNIICQIFNIASCLKMYEVNYETILKHNMLSAVCIEKHDPQTEEMLSSYYNNLNEYDNFYNKEVFDNYCLNADAFSTIKLYEMMVLMHHDFQNIFVIYNNK